MKNVTAIEKIIAELSLRDFKAKWNSLTEKKKEYYRFHDGFNYSLGGDTMRAVDVKNDYLADKISEEEYKAFCLKYNITGITV